ncbi:MAG: hypothetical protein HF978_12470 [Desulfobacteraceae bacterium]|nr:hypothetical protein [Desulfobacteraceae bacterium]MBC2756352.1 hypothetical protein [Desulfobacteraceae bacterium]
MAFINTIPPGKATGETAEVYKSLAQVEGHGMIPKIVQIFSLKPASMKMMIQIWEMSMWMGDEPRYNREMVAAAVSRFNECHY